MQKTIDVLVDKAHEYMQLMATFNSTQGDKNRDLIANILESGVICSGLHPEVRRDIANMDSNTENIPVVVAGNLLDDIIYGSQEIQEMLERVAEFRKYDTDTFRDYGKFLSVMIARTLNKEQEIVLDTKNNAVVHVPDFYMNHSKQEYSYPWKMEKSLAYERDMLLIAHLGSRLKHGRVVVCGNVGRFFAYKNKGADVRLDGECSWRACYRMSGGTVTINGTAGHDTGRYAYGGQIVVNGTIRSIADDYNGKIFHNGRLVQQEMLG